MDSILSVENLTIAVQGREAAVERVRGLTFAVAKGRTTVLAGESGSGKSLTAHSIFRLLPAGVAITGGRILFNHSADLAALSEREMRKFRGSEIGIVLQDALAALNPTGKIGPQIAEGLRIHRNLPKREAHELAIEWMERVGIADAQSRAGQYPHQLSGGMRQRVLLAMALCLEPKLLIADEPTTALDATVQAQILDLLQELQAQTGISLLLITHDLGVAARMADRMVVVQAGQLIEEGPVERIFEAPSHPYTKSFIQAAAYEAAAWGSRGR